MGASERPNGRIFDIPMVHSVSHLNGSIQFPLVPELENISQNLRVGATETKNPKFKFAHGETFWKKRFLLFDLQLKLKFSRSIFSFFPCKRLIDG